jgi:hypothetical protein
VAPSSSVARSSPAGAAAELVERSVNAIRYLGHVLFDEFLFSFAFLFGCTGFSLPASSIAGHFF